MATPTTTTPPPSLSAVLAKVHQLSDVELALLLSLATHEHPILATPSADIAALTDELVLIARQTFRLTHAIVACTPSTTLDDFTSALLLAPPPPPANNRAASSSSSSTTTTTSSSSPPASQIANCILAQDLDLAPRAVQIQALELLRTRRIFTRTSVQPAPKRFLFIPVLRADRPGGRAPRLTPHLNDVFALSHWHDPQDGYANLDDDDDDDDKEEEQPIEVTSLDGSVRKRRRGDSSSSAFISDEDVNHLAHLTQQVQVDIDVTRYQMNIVSFLRMHRAVHDGITPAATKHFDRLARCLAPIHGLDYLTPALVAIAARKIYMHRIRITTPENERSMQWGSDLDAVAALLRDVGPEQVIKNVLSTVTAPI